MMLPCFDGKQQWLLAGWLLFTFPLFLVGFLSLAGLCVRRRPQASQGAKHAWPHTHVRKKYAHTRRVLDCSGCCRGVATLEQIQA
jgi:hypothetical protein